MIKSYGYHVGSAWGSDPLYMRENGENYFYLNDHLGTPQKMIGQSGGVVWSAHYASYGKAMIDNSSQVENNLRYAGQYYDSETGLHYNWHRYYDPGTGRYMTPDQIGLNGGINLYAYVNGNPVGLVDPEGLAYSPGGEHGQPYGGDNNANIAVQFGGGGHVGTGGMYMYSGMATVSPCLVWMVC